MVTECSQIKKAFEKGIVQGKVAQVHEHLISLRKLRNVKAHNSAKGKFVAG